MTPSSRILAVVVLYRTALAESKTLAGLALAIAEDPALLDTLELLLWDNSPGPAQDASLPFPVHYHHAERNEGVAGAYNGAMQSAREQGAAWMLLLDHDTAVTGEFLHGIVKEAEILDADTGAKSTVAAVAPFLYAGSVPVSPRLWRLGRHVPLPRPPTSYTERRRIFAANSGLLVRVAALQAIGGYSRRFWLDYSDIYVFEQFHRRGYGVRIAGKLALQHEVAMLDYDTRMTPARYATYLAAESDFLDLYRGPSERLLHLGRLAVRTARQQRYADRAFSRMSLQELWRRLRVRREARLQARN